QIGQTYTVTGSAVNDHGFAAAELHVTPTQENLHDGGSEDLMPVEIDAFPMSVGTATLAAPPALTWRWVDQPTYHVHEDDLERDIRYTARTTWTDEFGNHYPPLVATGVIVRVRVSDTKVSAANTAETLYWVNVGIVAVVAVVGAVLTVASAG